MATAADARPAVTPTGLTRYRNAHLWLLIPFAIVVLGFVRSYYLKFPDVPWAHHLHLVTATGWYMLVIAQPWLATHGQLERHRRWGLFGVFLAGMVVASALVGLTGNIENAGRTDMPPIVSDTFFYGVTFADLVTIIGFSVAVVMAVLQRRQVHDHAAWMISSVLWVLFPALVRLMVLPVGLVLGFEGLSFIKVIYITVPLLLVVMAYLLLRFRFQPAMVWAFVGNLSFLLVEPVGDSATWRAICDAVFT